MAGRMLAPNAHFIEPPVALTSGFHGVRGILQHQIMLNLQWPWHQIQESCRTLQAGPVLVASNADDVCRTSYFNLI